MDRYTSFRVSRVIIIIEFDVSLSGISIIWYVVDEESNEHPVGATSVDISMLGFGEESQHQNSAEFIAATIGLLELMFLLLDGSVVKLRGDSRSALCWGATMKFKGARAGNEAPVFTLRLMHAEVTIVYFALLNSEQNVKTDELSRQGSVQEVVQRFSELKGMRKVLFPAALLERTLRDCDPNMVLKDDVAFSNQRRLLVLKEELV
jgi:hypothetical protein